MATYAITLSFTVGQKDDEAAHEMAERIGAYVVQEDMASDFVTIDVEMLDDEPVEELDFEEDDE